MFEFNLPTNELLTRRLRYLIQTEHNGSYAKLFEQLYDEVPDEGRLKLFKAYVDAGNVNGIFIRRLAEKTKIGQVSFSRFFDLYVDNAELFGD
ncbi:hypothetical protein KIH87_14210 [Paraneptunicella aestuarii]|uniref:hypothetical protein n=1 Tax=Paraneptunicella aestuarii TaxID=2831148 RepID=UPI001E604F8C|nr:hypothetical protein [Paraneptunicella aestuarii]UAA37844.1 hypothetical protein KIH87_14210 [Paraneptunicella aestuarii]